MVLDYARSQEIANRIDAEKQMCYKNALMALFCCNELAGSHYIEGWAVSVIPLEHGWLELLNGTIIDPTLALFPEEPITYFPGVRYSKAGASLLVEHFTLPFVHRFGHFGMANQDYRAASQAAMAAVLGRQ